MFGLSHNGSAVMIALNSLHGGCAVGDVALMTIADLFLNGGLVSVANLLDRGLVPVADLADLLDGGGDVRVADLFNGGSDVSVADVFDGSGGGITVAVADLLDRGLVSVADLLLDNGLLNVSVLVGMVAGVTVVHVREHGIVLVRFAVSIVMLMPEITDKAATGASFSTAHGAAVIVLMRVCGLLNVTNLVGFSVGVALARGAGAVS